MKQLKLWKRNAVVLAIVVFVCGAVYMNWSYNQEGLEAGKNLGEAALVDGKSWKQKDAEENDVAEGNGTESSYFSEARLNRQEARDSALSLLREAGTDENASEETMEEANVAIQTMAGHTLAEAQIENLVMAKGYTNCVAFLSDNGISVVVSGAEDGLQSADIAKIGEIVMEQTGFEGDQVKIIETN